MFKSAVALLAALLFTGLAQAAIDTFEFSDESQRKRYSQLIAELRCPKCQNQNIADSNAPIALDLRREVYRMFGEGKSDAEIVSFLVERYGDFVLYNPPVDRRTWLLWYGPGALLVGGLSLLGLIVWRRRRNAAAAPAELSSAEQARLQTLLHEESRDTRNHV
jgi:cytochrome c-type biogenesis protein CcmH